MKPQPRYQPGDRIGGRYQVHKVLMGGMGEVYLCLDLEETIPVALKTFQHRYITDFRRIRNTFEQEVATWVALEKHPNIVRCYYLNILNNQPFMVLEWIAGAEGKGTDLRSWLRHGPLDLKLALGIAIDISNGLLHAQTKRPGLVHCDLKPENILISQDGIAKITDFGLAQIAQSTGLEIGQESITTNGFTSINGGKGIAGTPAYMAPEQWRGEPLGIYTDIYAFGCILYELVTGVAPFQVDFAPTTPQQMQRWLAAMQRAPETSAYPKPSASLPVTLHALLARCLAKSVQERSIDLIDLLTQLTALYQQQFYQPPPIRIAVGSFTATDYTNRGLTYHDLGQYERALKDFDRALGLDPNYVIAYSNRGNTYAALGQHVKALDSYERAISLNPNLAQVYNNRGNRYATLGQATQALADYDRAIELDPKFAEPYVNRGNTHVTLGQHAQALADYNRAIELDPNFATPYTNRGNIYAALGQHVQALADYQHALALNPNLASAYLNIGALLATQASLEEALPYFEQAATLGEAKGAEYAAQARQMIHMEAESQIHPIEQAIIAFQEADTLIAMSESATNFPVLLQIDFMAKIERVIMQQIQPEHRHSFMQRLAWLREIANSQNIRSTE